MSRVGVYIDVSNLAHNGGRGMRYGVLREFAARDGGSAVRLNAYVAYDEARAREDASYRAGSHEFHAVLRDFGYKVIAKTLRWYRNDAGELYAKANADLDMAVDALLQSDNLDRVVLATGDGDFVQVVRALQNKGCRVEVVAFDKVSSELKREADLFMSGYLIPHLLATESDRAWGDEGSRVRGICYYFNSEKQFGFMRYLRKIAAGLWNIDTRHADSPYGSAFVHVSEFPAAVDSAGLPNRTQIFEFRLEESEKGTQAKDVRLCG